MAQGKFITIYGVNNIGKSTHSKRLVEHLKQKGYDAVYLKYPIYDLAPTGPELNRILRQSDHQEISEKELQTIFKQNRQDFEPQLKKMLEEGKIVIAEDYSGTGIAWGRAKGLDKSWIEDLNKNLLKEDLAILLTGKRSMYAREAKHLHEQDDELVQKVSEILNEMAKSQNWQIIEIQPKIEDTAENIWITLEKFLKN